MRVIASEENGTHRIQGSVQHADLGQLRDVESQVVNGYRVWAIVTMCDVCSSLAVISLIKEPSGVLATKPATGFNKIVPVFLFAVSHHPFGIIRNQKIAEKQGHVLLVIIGYRQRL
jgi:hypothetical protein